MNWFILLIVKNVKYNENMLYAQRRPQYTWNILQILLSDVWPYLHMQTPKILIIPFYSVLFLFLKDQYALQSFLFRPLSYVWFRMLFSNECIHVRFDHLKTLMKKI